MIFITLAYLYLIPTIMTKQLYIIFNLVLSIVFFACHSNKKESIAVASTLKKIAPVADTLIFKDAVLAKLVKHTEKLFSIYDTVSPSADYDVRQFGLNRHDQIALRRVHEDSISTSYIVSYITHNLSNMIWDDLVKILKWKNIDDYDLSLLLKNHISVAKSPDGKLYNFSFDEKTGGTYKSAISIIYYNPAKGVSYIIDNEEPDKAVFKTDGYFNIDTINTRHGVKYLLNGGVTSCMTCADHYVDLVHFEKGKFVNDFSYNVSIRRQFNMAEDNREEGIDYDNKNHIIKINYQTNDLTPTCNCGKYGVISPGSAEEDDKSGNINCIYGFNGKTFVLKSKKANQ